MNSNAASPVILLADDDPDDRLLIGDAFRQAAQPGDLRFVSDGEELMDYLRRRGPYADRAEAPRPDVILLDLNMPRLDGREALRAIKTDEALRGIPVVILSTTKAHEEIARAYDAGANSFITKPVTFDRLVEVVAGLEQYWLRIVELPHERRG